MGETHAPRSYRLKLNGREMKALFVLSIVVPVSLLAVFRLSGLLPEPLKLMSFSVDAVQLRQERPVGAWIHINDTVANAYQGEDVSVSSQIFAGTYDEYEPFRGDTPVLNIQVTGTANVSDGFVESVRVVFREDFESSTVEVPFVPQGAIMDHFYQLKNLSLTDYAGFGLHTSKLTNDTKAFVTFAGVNKPSGTHFDFWAQWDLMGLKNQSHLLQVAVEFTYRTKQVYRTVILPTELTLYVDNNNSFERAEEIHEGNYTKLFIGTWYYPKTDDPEDYYKIYLVEGQEINVSADSSAWLETNHVPYFNLYLYDPALNLVAGTKRQDYVQNVHYVANSTGFWYIEVQAGDNSGYYSLVVNS